MAIKVIELMNRVNSRDEKKVLAYVKDALTEMAGYVPDTVERHIIDIVADTRLYTLPSDMVRLLNVYSKYETTSSDIRYAKIPYAIDYPLIDDVSSSALDSDDDIIII